MNESLTTVLRAEPLVVLAGAAHLDRIAMSDLPFRPGCSNPGRLVERFGGAAFNAALALRAFGVGAHLVSACGGDEVAERVGVELDRRGIEDGRIAWLDRRSATYTALVDNAGELIGGVADMAIYDRLAPRVLARRHLVERLSAAAGLLIDANLPAVSIEQLARLGAGRPVAAIAVSPAKAPRLSGALTQLGMVFASRAELSALLDLPADASDEETVRAAAAAGLRSAVITDGPRPVLAIEGAHAWHQAPPSVDAVTDVVGAGDTLAGATLAGVLAGLEFVDAVRLGLAGAALRISTGLDASAAATARDIARALPEPRSILV